MNRIDGTVTDTKEREERWRGYVERMKSGDSEALANLYDETSSQLYGLALRLLRNPLDAEEAVLDVYQQVWRSVHSFKSTRGTVWAWLIVLTRSRAIDRLRSGNSRRSWEMPMTPGVEIHDGARSPEHERVLDEQRTLVRAAGCRECVKCSCRRPGSGGNI